MNGTETINGHVPAPTVALGFHDRGWAPIPIPPGTKFPPEPGWESWRLTKAEIPGRFRANSNIGVLNGEPSGWIVDVDLDHELARELADEYLPRTQSEFGRESSRRSHRLYRVTGPVETAQHRLPKVGGKAPMIVELRSTGSQTVFPGSVHPDGERIEWDEDGPPAEVPPKMLAVAVEALAAAVVAKLGIVKPLLVPARAPGNGKPLRIPSNVIDRARKYLTKMPPAVSGAGGHDQTFSVACVLRQGFSLDREPALALISEWNQTCQPPWEEWELEHKIDDAGEAAGERGYLLNAESGPHFVDAIPPAGALVPVTAKTRHNLTDVGNAGLFAEQHKDALRYCHRWRKWFHFNGAFWEQDTSGVVVRLAKQTARSRYMEAAHAGDKQEAEAIARWAAASERRERINAMVALAESELPIAVAEFDANPYLFNVLNGTIDLRTGELHEHRRDNFITKICRLEYPTDDGADPEQWIEFLNQILVDAELIAYLRRFIGMALIGAVLEHVLLMLFGSGANGKSVFVNVIAGMLGEDYSLSAPPNLLMASKGERHPTEQASLFGKRLVSVVETADGGRLSEVTVKSLTGGDTISARRMGEDFWSFKPSHTFVLCTNHRPTITGTDFGIWRRIALVPFTVTIPPGKQDKALAEKLKAEWPLILRWAVSGCIEWQNGGLNPPKVVQAATGDYRADMDVLGEFIQERCTLAEGNWAKASDLYRNYKAWAEKRGEFVETQTKFGVRLTERGFIKGRDIGNRVIYRGIGQLPEGPDSSDTFPG